MSQFRILAIAHDFPPRLGGIATLTSEVLRSLGRNPGVDVRVLAPCQAGDAEWDASSLIPTRRLSLPQGVLPAAPLVATYLTQEILTYRPNVILNFLWLPDGAASLWLTPLRLAMGVPYFLFAYGKELLETETSLKKRVRATLSPAKHLIFSQARATFAISEFTRDLLVEQCGLDPKQIDIAYPGISPDRFHAGDPPQSLLRQYGCEKRRVLFTLTRLEHYKGIDVSIQAIARVKERFADVLLLVGGEGPDRERLEGLVRAHGVQDHVKLIGRVDPSLLSQHMTLGEAFVLLSRTDLQSGNVEGFGIVFLEAAACGRPSIGGRSGAVPEAIGGPEYGWLVDPLDVAQAADAMIDALSNPAQTRQRGEAARRRAISQFTWDQTALKVLERMRRG